MRHTETIELPETPKAHSVQRLVRPIAALCVQRNSVYHHLEGVEAYDMKRDARSFPGGMPIVAHPPCRAWSAYCAHQARPAAGEKELGVWCAEMLRKCGGVLEQPAHSRLFDAACLPKPGVRKDGLWTTEVWQAWWGYPMKKATWLCFAHILPTELYYPLVLHPQGYDRRREQLMGKNQRSATNEKFARYLVAAARMATL